MWNLRSLPRDWTHAHWKCRILTIGQPEKSLKPLSFNETLLLWVSLLFCEWASLVAQMVKASFCNEETWVRSLDWEDPLEKEMAAHSSILAWKIPWMAEPGGLLSMGSQRARHDWATSLHFCQINNGIFHRLRQIILKFVWKHKTTYPEKKTKLEVSYSLISNCTMNL